MSIMLEEGSGSGPTFNRGGESSGFELRPRICIHPEEGTRRLRDTEPTMLRNLLREFEDSGIIDFTINAHSCNRPEGLVGRAPLFKNWGSMGSLNHWFHGHCAGQEGDTDFFMVTPDDASPLVFKYVSMENKEVRFTSIASALRNRELLESRALNLTWRLTYNQDDQDSWMFCNQCLLTILEVVSTHPLCFLIVCRQLTLS